MSNPLFIPEVWESAWKNDPHTQGYKMKKGGIDAAQGLGKRAASFNEQSFNEEGKQRTKRIIRWLQGQGVDFEKASILDIGAASGVFSLPFAELGATVTAIEPSVPLASLLEANITEPLSGHIEIVREQFENISIEEKAWNGKFDLVFASMCPAITDWEMVEKAISCAKQHCYISTLAGPQVHSLIQELRPVLGIAEQPPGSSDTAYLTQLLYLKGYSFESLITREVKTAMLSIDEAVRTTLEWMPHYGFPVDEGSLKKAEGYIRETHNKGMVEIQQGGRFGKVLVHLQNQHMYTREVE
ncbi:class I SAM-dependent methyltransferase [Paenibacillus agricola]|uniref:Class I SAM-dependent methyltransferase n=1 Tax=Paenibacillus agricola TaxID=2716264 RepID=A0ABX0JEC8_9BACL|nr:class I SAM-dependent methyltransferase [Paenibacillus agricola]NHN34502.1 class I SAM-dependent methyltransferase [Paenibacillus agricola]